MYRMASLCSKSCSYRLSIFLSGLALFIGGLIYILLRPSEHIFFEWFSRAGLENWVDTARAVSPVLGRLFPDWIIYSLPNGLWAFAYALLITTIWSGSISSIKYLWLASMPVLVLGFEFMQYPGIIPGTFCMQDIALGLAGLSLGIFIGTINHKNHNCNEKDFD